MRCCQTRLRPIWVADPGVNDEGDDSDDSDDGDGGAPAGTSGPAQADDGAQGGDDDDDDDQNVQMRDLGTKTHRKRRELTNIAVEDWAAAYNPGQHCGLDDGVRSTKHWDKIRIRFKAAVHSGSIVNFLNDCRTKYTFWMEEKNWHSKRLEGDDINTKVSVLKRAVQPLIDKQKDAAGRSTAGVIRSPLFE